MTTRLLGASPHTRRSRQQHPPSKKFLPRRDPFDVAVEAARLVVAAGYPGVPYHDNPDEHQAECTGALFEAAEGAVAREGYDPGGEDETIEDAVYHVQDLASDAATSAAGLGCKEEAEAFDFIYAEPFTPASPVLMPRYPRRPSGRAPRRRCNTRSRGTRRDRDSGDSDPDEPGPHPGAHAFHPPALTGGLA
jgi:hypothetical protein